VHEETLVPVEEEPELEEYKSTMSWLEECRKSGYNAWHEKHKKEHKKVVVTCFLSNTCHASLHSTVSLMYMAENSNTILCQ